ncbi:2-dehydropantoate 2-reductase N-terminal domain-containing protein [Clostridium tyrobutyricum]|uniref:2-dehydropantoate 2-reductase N-terminal domain-containing protein n=1 Tax=Clostridium tyrobutyricum TaxID=1519 RepID=UPI0009B810AB
MRWAKTQWIYCNKKQCAFCVVSSECKSTPADLLIFAVKSTALVDAIQIARNQVGNQTIILLLLNDITSESITVEAFGLEKLLLCRAGHGCC